MLMTKILCLLFSILVISDLIASSETTNITVNLDKPGVQVSPLLYGIFFEDINRSGDGGLYGEGSSHP
jgi:hypothetical protein